MGDLGVFLRHHQQRTDKDIFKIIHMTTIKAKVKVSGFFWYRINFETHYLTNSSQEVIVEAEEM